MRFLGDIPIARVTLDWLRSSGHDCAHVVECLRPNASDAEIVQRAILEQRIVLCFDLDIAAIVATSRGKSPSVITFRTTRRSASYITQRLAAVLPAIENELPDGVLVVVTDFRVRVRKLPVLRP